MPRGEIHIQLVVNYDEDPKVRALARYGRDARACRDLWVQLVCYCKRTLSDGFVPDDELPLRVYPDPPKIAHRDAARLVEVGLIERVDGGYLLPSFLKRNKSKAQVEADSEAKSERGRQGGIRSGETRRTKQPASPNPTELVQESEAP
jgi:hypothetical protein